MFPENENAPLSESFGISLIEPEPELFETSENSEFLLGENFGDPRNIDDDFGEIFEEDIPDNVPPILRNNKRSSFAGSSLHFTSQAGKQSSPKSQRLIEMEQNNSSESKSRKSSGVAIRKPKLMLDRNQSHTKIIKMPFDLKTVSKSDSQSQRITSAKVAPERSGSSRKPIPLLSSKKCAQKQTLQTKNSPSVKKTAMKARSRSKIVKK
jgi:hypothetical protein